MIYTAQIRECLINPNIMLDNALRDVNNVVCVEDANSGARRRFGGPR